MKTLVQPIFHRLLPSLLASFFGWRLLLHGAALGLTFLLVFTAWDFEVRNWFLEHEPLGGGSLNLIYFWVGEAWHVFLGLLLLRQGYYKKDRRLLGGGGAVLQALLATVLVIAVLKVLTGRPPPLATERASEFHLFELPLGSKVMWPSGHTAAAFSVAAALHVYYAHLRWVPWLLYPLATFVGLTMVNGQFHWASDVVAGGLIAFPIGRNVGLNLARWAEEPGPPGGEEAPA